jgi:error-prone DNA polymerase
LRLGLCYVRALKEKDATRIVAARARAPFASIADFQLRTALPKSALRAMASAGALNGLAVHRRAAQWEIEVIREADDLFAKVESSRTSPLAPMNEFERARADFAGTSLTVGPHPMALIRDRVPHLWRASELEVARNGERVVIGGTVICRQRPGTAKGVVFLSVEDETGVTNAIVTSQSYEKFRLVIGEEPFLAIEGIVQNVDHVIHIKAERIIPLPFGQLPAAASHDFH